MPVGTGEKKTSSQAERSRTLRQTAYTSISVGHGRVTFLWVRGMSEKRSGAMTAYCVCWLGCLFVYLPGSHFLGFLGFKLGPLSFPPWESEWQANNCRCIRKKKKHNKKNPKPIIKERESMNLLFLPSSLSLFSLSFSWTWGWTWRATRWGMTKCNPLGLRFTTGEELAYESWVPRWTVT